MYINICIKFQRWQRNSSPIQTVSSYSQNKSEFFTELDKVILKFKQKSVHKEANIF